MALVRVYSWLLAYQAVDRHWGVDRLVDRQSLLSTSPLLTVSSFTCLVFLVCLIFQHDIVSRLGMLFAFPANPFLLLFFYSVFLFYVILIVNTSITPLKYCSVYPELC